MVVGQLTYARPYCICTCARNVTTPDVRLTSHIRAASICCPSKRSFSRATIEAEAARGNVTFGGLGSCCVGDLGIPSNTFVRVLSSCVSVIVSTYRKVSALCKDT